jgi:hypothetical protein
VSPTLTEQQGIPTEVFEQYAGKWVAVRDGSVVAAAESLEELRENPEVTRADAVFVVPDRSSSFF